jgi:hypothetical protein
MFLIGLLAVPALVGAAPPQELTLQRVLKANTAAIQAIRSIHVVIDIANNFQVSGEDKPPAEAVPTYTIEWFKDGKRERVRRNWLRGRRPNNYDAYNGPDGWKRLSNYDLDFKPPLSESISAPAVGEIGKTHTDDYLSGSARNMSYMTVFGKTAEEYLLKNPTSKLAATPATSKLGCYEITRLQERREVGEAKDDVRDLRIFVDPKAGFWIRRIEVGPWQKSTDPNDKGTTISEIREFKDCGNGIFWPLRGYNKTRLPGLDVGPDMFIRHTLHSINQPLPNGDFQIRFPDWLRVYDRASGKVFIWGPDDKPRMEFASQAEYREWYRPRQQDPFQPMTGLLSRTRWIWLAGISLGVGLVLLFIRRRSRATQRLKMVAGEPEIPR